MKKQRTTLVVATAIALALSFTNTPVKAQLFNVGDKDLNMMIGFGSTWYSGSYYSVGLPPVSLSLDYGLRDDWGPGVFSLGGYIGASTYKWEYFDWGYRYTTINVAARATYHYQFVDKLDTYAGLMFGIRYVSGKEFGTFITGYSATDYSGVHLILPGFVGAKYYFTEKFAGMVELGYGIAYFNVGLGFKL